MSPSKAWTSSSLNRISVRHAPRSNQYPSPLTFLQVHEQEKDLRNLDIMCSVAAISATTIYRVFSGGGAPFPDNSTTTALTNAKDYRAFQQTLEPRNSPTELQAAPRPAAHWLPAASPDPTSLPSNNPPLFARGTSSSTTAQDVYSVF
ncbi:MAG: hypothetical protein Q9198_002855 [Flavoplaca austrocitrina]